MKAVNLIPSESRGSRTGLSLSMPAPAWMALGVLVALLVMVTLYVSASNTIADRTAQLASLQSQVTNVQAQASHLGPYAQFSQLAQKRVQTVEGIAAARFDWSTGMADLSRVVPANVSLKTLSASVVPGAGSSSGALRSDIAAPAFEFTGCSDTQDDVARLMSRLRVIAGVTRVSLTGSEKPSTAQIGSSSSTDSTSCPGDMPTFDIVVFFQPVAGAGATGVTSLTAAPTTSGSLMNATQLAQHAAAAGGA